MESEDNSLEQGDEATVYDSSLELGPVIQSQSLDNRVGGRRLSPFRYNKLAFAVTGAAVLVIALVGITSLILGSSHKQQNATQGSPTANYAVGSLSLDNVKGAQLQVSEADHLSVNGQLQVGNTLILSPTASPSNPTAGQIYYDQKTNSPYYYNGSQFISLGPVAAPQLVTSLGGTSGTIGVGGGLQVTTGQLALSSAVLQALGQHGVTSVQGATGAVTLTAGGGIGISGTVITNTGVLGSGNNGTIALFNSGQTLGDSILSQSGLTLTANGSLAVNGTITTDTLQHSTTDLAISAGTNHIAFTDGNLIFKFPTGLSGPQTICTNGSVCASGSGTAVLLQPGAAQPDSGAGSSIFVNNTGGGNLLQLQGNGTNKFVVTNNGNATLSGNLTVSSGTVTAGVAGTTAGSFNLANATNGNVSSLQATAPTGSGTATYFLPSIAGGTNDTICLSTAKNCTAIGGAGGDLTGNYPNPTIAANAVTTIKIADANVTNAKLQNSSLTVTAGAGLSGGGAVSLGGTTSLSVAYGSSASTAVQGNVQVTCPSGTGNLTGGGTVITLGTGGTCGGITTNAAVNFGTSVTTPLLTSSGALTLSSTGANDLTLTSGSNNIALNATSLTTNNTNLSFDLKGAASNTLTIKNTGTGTADLNLANGGLQIGATTVITSGRVLQNVTADTSILTSGTLATNRGGTGLNSFTANSVLYASNASTISQATASAGQVLLGNASSVPTFTTVNGDVTISNTGVTTIGVAKVTNADLVNSSLTVTAGAGLSGGGAVSLGGTTSLSVAYGSSASTAVQGNVQVTCPSGTGNLTGGGTVITLGTGGTCGGITTNAAVNFGTSVTTPLLTSSANLAVTAGGTGTLGLNTSDSTTANTANVTITSGNASSGSNLSAGTVRLDTGTTTGLGTATVNIGNTNATAVNIGNTSATLLLQGSGLTLTIAGQSYSLPATGGTFCVKEAGNCTGTSSGAVTTTGTPTTNTIALFSGSSSIANSILSQTGTTITNSGNLIIQGANSLTLGVAAITQGSIVFNNAAGGATHTVTLQAPATDPISNVSLTLPTTGGSGGDCLQSSGGGVLAFHACTGGTAGGVTSITGSAGGSVAANGTINLNNAATTSSTITINNAKADAPTTGTKGIATFNSTNFADNGGGTINTIQDITTTSNVGFRTLNLTGTAVGDNLIVANAVSGATGNLLNLKVNGTSKLSVDASGNLTAGTINTATISGGTLSGGTLSASAVNSLNVGANAISASSGNLTIDANGSGTVSIGGISTGDILLGGGSGSTGCTITNSSGNFNCSGTLTVQNNAVVQGSGGLTLGVQNTTTGNLNLATLGDNNGITTLQALGPNSAGDATIQIPAIAGTATDTVCLKTLANCVGVGGAVATTATGAGNLNFVTKFSNATGTTVADSQLFDNGSFVGINTATNGGQLSVVASGSQTGFYLQGAGSGSSPLAVVKNTGSTGDFLELQNSSGVPVTTFDSAGNLSFNSARQISTTSGNLTLQGGSGTVSLGSSTNLTASSALQVAAGGTNQNLTLSSSGTGSVVAKPGTDSATAFQVQTAGGAALLVADTANLRVDVGTIGTATGQLYVSGRVPTGVLGSITGTGTPNFNSLTIQGRYAYVVDGGNDKLNIYDVSNPASPALISSTLSVPSGCGNPISIAVHGRYAYIGNDCNFTFDIYDVSNPASPVNVSGDVLSFYHSIFGDPNAMYADGSYVYVATGGGSPSQLGIIDVSNPAKPVTKGTVNINYGTGVYAQGRYAYVADPSGNLLNIYDVSNPASPSFVGSIAPSDAGGPWQVYVQGRYAYVGGSHTLQIFDVSNPASPSVAGSVSLGGSSNPYSIYVQGRYAYISDTSAAHSIDTVDVSNPASPTLLGSVSIGTDASGLYVQGRYAYYVNNAAQLQTLDLGGSYIQQLEVGGLETGTLSANGNAAINGDASIQGGLTVAGNSQLSGNLGVNGQALFVNTANSTTAFQVQSANSTPVFTVNTTNSQVAVRGANSSATLGSELSPSNDFTIGSNWTTTNWTTTATNATHTTGNTSGLVDKQFTPAASQTYQVIFTVSGSPTAGQTITPTIGGTSGQAISGNDAAETQLIQTSSTAQLQFVPTSSWNGTISAVSVKLVTSANATLAVQNSSGTTALEIRAASNTSNTFVGLSAGQSITSGSSNTALGSTALQSNTSGFLNTAAGYGALQSNTTGGDNTAFGGLALNANTTGIKNTAVGNQALSVNATGSNNTALGNNAGITGTVANANMAGSNNTFVGYNSGPGSSTQLQNATAVGTYAVVSQNDSLVLGCVSGVNGCTANTKVGIDQASPAYTLDVNGTLGVSGLSTLVGIANSGAYTQTGANANTLSGATAFSAAGTALTVNNNALVSGQLNVGSGSQFQVDSSGNITTSGTATLGVAGTTNGSLILDNASNAHITTLRGLANTSQDQVITIPASPATTDTVCLFTLANCVGAGGAVTTTSGTQNFITKYNNAGATQITSSQLFDNGSNVGINVAAGFGTNTRLTVNGNTTNTNNGIANNNTVAQINTGVATNIGLVVQGTGSQTADLLQLQDSTGANLHRVDSSGNQEQLGYFNNGYGGIGQFANLLTYSEQLDNVNWAANNVTVTANSTVAPDQQTTAETLADSVSGGSLTQVSATAAASTTFSGSVWLKTSSGTQAVDLRLDSTNTTGTKATVTATTTWQRFSVTQVFGGGATGNTKFIIFPGGTGTSGTVIAWGGQLVTGANPQAYVRTTTNAAAQNSGVVSNGGLYAVSINASDVPLTVQAAPSQTGNLLNVVDSTNATLATISSSGALTAAGVNATSGLLQGAGGLTVSGTAQINNSAGSSNTSINNGTSTGTVNIGNASSGTIAIQGGNTSSAVTIKTASGGTLSLGDNGVASTIQIGNTSGAVAQTINIGNNPGGSSSTAVLIGNTNGGNITLQSAATINIGHNAAAQTINIGNVNGTSGIVEQVGSGNYSLDGVAASTYSLGASTTTGTITIGGTAQTGNITLGSSTGASSVLIGNGTGATTVSIANSVATATGNTVNIAGGATASGLTDTVNIGTGNTVGTGAKVIHIGDGTPTGTNTVTIGSIAATADVTTIQGGNGSTAVNIQAAASGTVNIATANNNNVALGTAAVAGTITVGGTTTTGTLTLGQSTASNTINIGNNTIAAGNTGTINIGTSSTGTGKTTVTLGSTNDGSSLTLQAGTGNINLTPSGSTNTGVLVQPINNSTAAFQVQNAAGANIFGADTSTTSGDLITNASFDTNTTGWSPEGSAVLTRSTTQAYIGPSSMLVSVTTAVGDGAKYPVTLTSSTGYNFSIYVRRNAPAASSYAIGWSNDGSVENQCITPTAAITNTGWTQLSCNLTTGTTNASSYVFINKTTANAGSIYVDAATLSTGSNTIPYAAGSLSLTGTINMPTFFRNASDSTNAFQIQSANGSNLLSVDTLNQQVNIGNTLSAATITAGTYQVNGAALASSNLADASNIALLNANNTFSGLNTFNGSGGAPTLLVKPSSNTTTAFSVKDSSSNNFIGVDNTSGGGVTIGNGSTNNSVNINAGGTGTIGLTAYGSGSISLDSLSSSVNIQSGTSNNLTLQADGGTDGVIVKPYTSNSTAAFQVQNVAASTVLQVDTTIDASNLVTNGSFEVATFGWVLKNGSGTSAITQTTTQQYIGQASMQVATSGTATNAGTTYNVTLSNATQYSLGFYAKLSSGTMTDLKAGYSNDGTQGGEANTTCTLNSTTVVTTGWGYYTCTFTTPGSNSGTPYLYISQSAATGHTYFLDAVKLEQTSAANQTAYKEGNISLNGNVGINGGSTSSVYSLNVAGSINASNHIYDNGVLVCTQLGCTPSAGSNNYIQNQAASAQSANLNIQSNIPGGVATTAATATLQVANTQTGNLLNFANTSGVTLSGVTTGGDLVANGAATATTATTSGTGTNTTTLTFSGTTSFANGDVIFINNVGPTFYTRIVSGGNAASVTVSPAVTFENARTVTKYNIQNIGAVGSTNDYSTTSNRFFQGYFLGGIVTGTNSTTLSDNSLQSAGALNFGATNYAFKNSSDSTAAFQIQNAAGTSNLLVADTANNKIGIGTTPSSSLGQLQVGATSSTTAASGLTFGQDSLANLYRSAAGTIKTDGSLNVAGSLTLGTVLASNYGGTGADLHTAAASAIPFFSATGVLGGLDANFEYDSGNKYLGIGGMLASHTQGLSVTPVVSGNVGIVVRGAASQAADLLQLRDSGNNVLAEFTNAGALQGGNASGSNVAGTTLAINGGQGTGSASGGNIVFQYAPAGSSGSTLNALQTACTISGTDGSFSCPITGGGERFGAGSSGSGNSQLVVGNGASATFGGNGYDVVVGNSATTTGQQNVIIGHVATSSGSGNTVIGEGSSSTGSNSIVQGLGTTNAGNYNVVIGYNSSLTGGAAQSVIIGSSVTSSAQSVVALGYQASAGNTGAIAIGASASANNISSIALGANATTTSNNQLVIGANGGAIQNAYIGNGVTNAAPAGFTLQGTGGSGSNIAGASVALAGGQGTGTGNGGNINFQIAKPGLTGSSLNGLATVASLSGTNGSALFQNSTNSTTAFQIQGSTGATATLLNADTTNMRLGVDVTYAAMTVPSSLASSPAAGGSLTAGAYKYEVTAIDSTGGETTVSNEVTGTTAGGNLTNSLTWTASTRASGYKVYRTAISGGTGTENYLTTVLANSYNDTGSITLSATAPPSTNTAYVSTNITNTNNLELSVGGNGTPTGQVYVSGTVPASQLGSVALSNNASYVSVIGNYAYIQNNSNLQIVDVSTPAAPVSVKTFNPCGTNGLYVQSRYAYVTCNHQLQIIDMSNPSNPVSVGSISTATNPGAVYVQGRYAYVVISANILQIIDVSNPANPVNVGQVATTSSANAIYVQGRYAYLAESSGTLQIIDVSNPANPTSAGSIAAGTTPASVYVQGRYAYVVNSSNLLVIDVSNPASPVNVGSVASAGSNSNSNSLVIQGRYAYIASGTSNFLRIVDISNPANPTVVGNVATASNARALAIQGRYAYVATYNGASLQTFDLGGAYTQQLQAGGTETGTLQVDTNATVAGDATIQGGLQTGGSIQTSANLGVSGGAAIQGSAVLSGGANSLATPAISSVACSGAGCTSTVTTWQYVVTAITASGSETVASTAVNTSGTNNADATLSTTNFNIITWGSVTGATAYKVYRTGVATSPTTTGLIGSTTSTSFNDTGLAGAGDTAPTINTTGQLTVEGSALFQNASNSTTAFQIQNAGSSTLFQANTVSQSDINSGTDNISIGINGASPTAGYALNVTGSVNATAIYDGGTRVCTSAGCAPVSGSTFYIQNNKPSAAAVQSANFYIQSADSATGATAAIEQAGSQTGDLLQLQDSSANVNARFNSTGNQLTLGRVAASGTVTQGKLVLSDGTTSNKSLTVQVDNGSTSLGASSILQVPATIGATDTFCLFTLANCAGGATLQTAYNNSGGGTTAEILLDTTRNGVDIQDRSTSSGGTTGASLLNVRATAANNSTLGTALFSVGNTGNITFKNTTSGGSTTAFQIQNSSSGSLFNVDSAGANITLNSLNQGETATWTTQGSNLPGTAVGAGGSAQWNGYIYLVAGNTTVGNSTFAVQYAKLNANGSTGAWTTTTSVPSSNCGQANGMRAIAVNGYLYDVGSIGNANVCFAKIKTDGTLGSWTQTTSMNTAVSAWQPVFANGYIYLVGGNTTGSASTNITQFAKPNPDGTISSWTTSATTLGANVEQNAAFVANGYLYSISGDAGNNAGGVTTTNFVKLNPLTGDLTGSWASANTVLSAERQGYAYVQNGYVYFFGGEDAVAPEYGLLSSSGTITWTNSANSLPSNISSPYYAGFNGYLYIIDGQNLFANASSALYYTSTSRVQIGGSLDLIGTATNNDSVNPGTGGSLTAGNTNIIGSLGVQGSASFNQNVAVNGQLAVQGNAALLGTLLVGSSLTLTNGTLVSGVADGGSAIGFTLNTAAGYVTAGAKLLSVQNNGTERFAIDKNGHIMTFATAPTSPTAAAGAGTSATCTLQAGNDTSGTIRVHTGSGSIAAGTWCTMTISFTTTPRPVVSGISSATAGFVPFISATTTTLTFGVSNVTGATTATDYDFNYFMPQ